MQIQFFYLDCKIKDLYEKRGVLIPNDEMGKCIIFYVIYGPIEML